VGVPEINDTILNKTTNLIRPELRHHRSNDFANLPFIQDLYMILEGSARTGEFSEEAWKISEEVGRSKALFQSWSAFIDSTQTVKRGDPSRGSEYSEDKLGMMTRIKAKVKKLPPIYDSEPR